MKKTKTHHKQKAVKEPSVDFDTKRAMAEIVDAKNALLKQRSGKK